MIFAKAQQQCQGELAGAEQQARVANRAVFRKGHQIIGTRTKVSCSTIGMPPLVQYTGSQLSLRGHGTPACPLCRRSNLGARLRLGSSREAVLVQFLVCKVEINKPNNNLIFSMCYTEAISSLLSAATA